MPDSLHHVGAKPLPLPDDVIGKATFSGPNNCYRYMLSWRVQHDAQHTIMWLMMNPSVASDQCADRTLLKCWRLSRRWGFTRMLVGNSAAYRTTDQRRLAEVSDPVGPANNNYLHAMAAQAAIIIAAYGKPRVKTARTFGPNAARFLIAAGHAAKIHTLRRTIDGTPEHVLFLPEDLKPRPWGGVDA